MAITESIKSSLYKQGAVKYLLAQKKSMFLKHIPWGAPPPAFEWDKSENWAPLSSGAKLEDMPQELIYVPQALFNVESREPDLK